MKSAGFGIAGFMAVLSLPVAGQPITLASTHPEQYGEFGSVVAAVPDLNGDGKQDIIVGAVNETVQGQAGAGRAYVYSGATGALIRVLISPHFQGNGWFGSSVAGVADVNGDGKGDLVVGASDEGNTGPNNYDGPGKVYVFSGATGAWLRTITSPNAEAFGSFGGTVAGVADLNGDGRGDIVVGAWAEDPGAAPTDCGRVYIFNGANGAVLRTLASPNAQQYGTFGAALGAIPDVSGDGKPDLAVGATGEAPGGVLSAGRTYIFNGATGAVLRTLVSPNKEEYGIFGKSVSGVADVNGDGKGDLLVGAPSEDPGASPVDSGRAYLYSGATGTLLRSFAPGVPLEYGGFGGAVAGIPDLNGDARGDVAIGAGNMRPPNTAVYGGRVFLYSGASGAFIKTLASPRQGPTSGFGASVVGLVDVNGNGKGDLVIGSPRENTPTIDEVGRAYLFKN